jgi:hypothetical protein
MQRREYLTRAAGLGALAVCGTTGAAAASTVAPGTNVLTIEDGTGDNNGAGDLVHPTNSDFYDGAWDVDVFRLAQDDSRVYFEFEMATEIQDTFGIGNGWSHEFFQLYIRDPNAGDDVSSGTTGREAVGIQFGDPYHYRVVAHAEGLTAVESPSGTELSTDVNVDVQTDTFVIDVPKSVIGGDPSDKEMALLVCPYDGYQPGLLRVIQSSVGDYEFGGGGSSTPAVIDMVTGSGQDQTEILDASGFGTPEIPYIDVDTESSDGGGDDGGGDDGGGGEGPTLPGQSNPARDPDGDGQFEDVNGDGTTDLFDALDYYNNGDSDAVQNNVDAFDFDGDGDAGDLFDALELWNRIS